LTFHNEAQLFAPSSTLGVDFSRSKRQTQRRSAGGFSNEEMDFLFSLLLLGLLVISSQAAPAGSRAAFHYFTYF
jgi:hypothetical protein